MKKSIEFENKWKDTWALPIAFNLEKEYYANRSIICINILLFCFMFNIELIKEKE